MLEGVGRGPAVWRRHRDRESRRRFCAAVGTSHQAIGLFPTPRCCFIRCKLPGPGGRRRTRAGAHFCDATDAVTLLLKGKTQCPCLQTRSRNQPRSAQRRREEHRAFRALGAERNLSFAWWLLPTRSHAGGESLCFAAGRMEAGRTRRTAEPGMKHVCSIYTSGFYVFM